MRLPLILCLMICMTTPSSAQSFFDLLNEFTNESTESQTEIVQEEAASIEDLLNFEESSAVRDTFAPSQNMPTNGIRMQGLDTETGRVFIIDAPVGKTIEFGSLHIKVHHCEKTPPEEPENSMAFLSIAELNLNSSHKKSRLKLLFSGWMFSTSPALSALDHPVYDVWVKECIDIK